MKRTLVFLLALAALLALCGCGSSAPEAPAAEVTRPAAEAEAAEPAPDTPEEAPTEPQEAPAEPDETPDEPTDPILTALEDEDIRALAEAWFDLSAYESGSNLRNRDAASDPGDTAEVDGVTLTLGMSYAAVIERGFVPTDEDMAGKEIVVTSGGTFRSPAGGLVDLLFTGESGTLISDGELYRISLVYGSADAASIAMAGIGGGSTIEEVADVLGAPYTIDNNKYDGRHMLQLKYTANVGREETITIDPETETVVDLTLEGYGLGN